MIACVTGLVKVVGLVELPSKARHAGETKEWKQLLIAARKGTKVANLLERDDEPIDLGSEATKASDDQFVQIILWYKRWCQWQFENDTSGSQEGSSEHGRDPYDSQPPCLSQFTSKSCLTQASHV